MSKIILSLQVFLPLYMSSEEDRLDIDHRLLVLLEQHLLFFVKFVIFFS